MTFHLNAGATQPISQCRVQHTLHLVGVSLSSTNIIDTTPTLAKRTPSLLKTGVMSCDNMSHFQLDRADCQIRVGRRKLRETMDAACHAVLANGGDL